MSSPVSAVASAAIAASGVGYQLHHDKDDYHRDDADDYILEHALGELYALASSEGALGSYVYFNDARRCSAAPISGASPSREPMRIGVS